MGSLDAKSDPLGPGSVVAGHVLERELGRGGMGVVFLARHEATGAERAVKVVEIASDPELALRFLREAEAMARADGHPNVVRVFAAGREGTRLHLVMERVPGGDLGRLLERDGPPPVERAVEWTLALCGAVAHLHARGVLHRDLKPQNVLLDGERPRLADFGLARLAGADALTRTGNFVGSPSYMAPEQAAGGEPDERTDVYGLGGVLYALLCGRPPFGADGGAARAISELLTRPPDPPSRHRPGVPAGLEAVCLRCLEKEPGARYPRAADLARDLERWRRGELGPRRAGLVGAAAAVGVAALGVVWWTSSRAPPPVRATPSTEVAAVASWQRERAEYLGLVSSVLGASAHGLRTGLERIAGRLPAAEREALEPLKREAIAAAVSGARDRIADRLAHPLHSGPLLDALAAVSQSPPAVGLPPDLERLLDDALLARLRALNHTKAADVDQLVDFELRRARALDHRRRPPPALRRALEDAFGSRGGEFPLPWLRVSLWADCDGLITVGVLSPREALRSVPEAELVAARAETPTSQALALARLERTLQATEKTSAWIQRQGLAAWRTATADGELAVSGPPTDLGPRWVYLARRLTMKVLFLRTCERLHEMPDEAASLLGRTVELGRLVVAEGQEHLRERTPLPSDVGELREAAECTASSLLRLGRARESLAVWEEVLAAMKPILFRPDTGPEVADQVREALREAIAHRTAAKDPGAAPLARAALAVARPGREQRDAVVDVLRAHVHVPELRAALGTVDDELVGDEAGYRARIARVDPEDTGGKVMVQVAVQSAALQGDLRLARARAAIGIALYPDLQDEVTTLLRRLEGR